MQHLDFKKVLIDRGTPIGFSNIARARQYVLDTNEDVHVVAPVSGKRCIKQIQCMQVNEQGDYSVPMINLAPFSIRRMPNLIGYGAISHKESNDHNFWYVWLAILFLCYR